MDTIGLAKNTEIQLHLSDSPYSMNIPVRGGLNNISLSKNEHGTFLHVETGSDANAEQTLIITVYPTGGLLHDVDAEKYLGTAMVGSGVFVWHIFYQIEDATNAPINEKLPLELSTIYKYELSMDGSDKICIESPCIKPLFAGMQFDEPMIWVLFKFDECDSQSYMHIICTENATEDGYTLLNKVVLDDGTWKNVFYLVED